MYDPNIPPVMHNNFDDYKKSTAPTINHFYEKLLLLKERLNTSAALQIANERHAFMETFLDRFFGEWNGEYNSIGLCFLLKTFRIFNGSKKSKAMRIEHIAIWTYNLEGLRNFYMHYFDASSSEIYHNHSKEFRSYFPFLLRRLPAGTDGNARNSQIKKRCS